jgi:hypothetical protein
MCLTAMQKDRDSSNRDVREYQGKDGDLPPRPVQIAIGQPVKQ